MRRAFAALLLALAACAARPAIRTGTSGDYPPLSVWRGDRAEGFAPALVEAFARSESTEVRWSRFRWPELVSDLRSHKFDLAADGITVRPERSIAGRFTVPIARGGAVLLLRRPEWAKSGELDRPELRIVVNRGGHLERVTRETYPHATVNAIPDNAAVRDAFARGEADAAMTNTFEAPRWSEGMSGIERIGPLTNDVTALWVRADREDLAERLDAWLLAEEEAGRLDVLRVRTLGAGAGPRAALPVSALLAATTERLALMPFVAAAKKRAGRPVDDPAQEERVVAAARASVPPEKAARAEEFFRAEIEAAKRAQETAIETPAFSLGDELRPAIARINAKMSFLLLRVPRGTTERDVLSQAEADLPRLPHAHVERLARAIAAFAAP